MTKLVCVSLSNIRPSFIIIRHRLWSALHRKPICLWRLYSQEGSQSNYEKLKQQQTSALNPFLGKVFKKICLFCSNVIASLWRALLVDALGEGGLTSPRQGGFYWGGEDFLYLGSLIHTIEKKFETQKGNVCSVLKHSTSFWEPNLLDNLKQHFSRSVQPILLHGS